MAAQRFEISPDARGRPRLFRIVGGERCQIKAPRQQWPALMAGDGEYFHETHREPKRHDEVKRVCWRCGKKRVRVYGIPCFRCKPRIIRAYRRELARSGRRYLYLPDPAGDAAPPAAVGGGIRADVRRPGMVSRIIDAVARGSVQHGDSAGVPQDGGSDAMGLHRDGGPRCAGNDRDGSDLDKGTWWENEVSACGMSASDA